MLVRSLGHASLEVRSGETQVLCDPWFSPEGAFQGSWFPFPENQDLLTPEILRPDAILISHEHLDHVDPWFLARVAPEVPIVVPRYPSSVLRHKIEAAGPRPIIELDPGQVFEVAEGVRAFFVSEESPMNHDSAMVVVADGRCLLNMNDARLSVSQLRSIRSEVGGHVDVLALQGAGASWYPMCYEYPTDQMVRLAFKKRIAKLRYVEKVIELVDPGASLPFAGPPCFLDKELFRHNEQMEPTGIFPDQFQVASWLANKGVMSHVLLPGDAWDSKAGEKHSSARWVDFESGDRHAYLVDYAQRKASQIEATVKRHPRPTESLWESFDEYFSEVLHMSAYFNDKIAMRVGFDIDGLEGGWAVDFRPGSEGVYRELGDCQYIYRFDSRWLPPILEHKVPWEDFFLSLRFSAWRHPDLYNDHLLGLLKFATREPLSAVEAYETSSAQGDSIEIEVDGRTYRIQRYCPHAGQDLLETGELLSGGVLRCLGHNYEFDLETGQCLNGSARPLRTERLV